MSTETSKPTYSLFLRDPDTRKWVRISGNAFPLKGARMFYQSTMIFGELNGLEMMLKRAPVEHDKIGEYTKIRTKYFPIVVPTDKPTTSS